MGKLGKMMMMNSAGRKMSIEYEDGGRRESDRYRDADARFRDGQGRERYNDGRYAPQSAFPRSTPTPYYYPAYDGTEPHAVGYNSAYQARSIGFDREMEPYMSTGTSQHATENHMTGNANTLRMMRPDDDDPHMTMQMAEEWMPRLQNADGSTGAHWTIDQTTKVLEQRGIGCDPVKFWAAMNMIYSDYSQVAKRLGVSNIDFFAEMAKAFLEDKDAAGDKIAKYYEFVVK